MNIEKQDLGDWGVKCSPNPTAGHTLPCKSFTKNK